jgi:hypothetical protein
MSSFEEGNTTAASYAYVIEPRFITPYRGHPYYLAQFNKAPVGTRFFMSSSIKIDYLCKQTAQLSKSLIALAFDASTMGIPIRNK